MRSLWPVLALLVSGCGYRFTAGGAGLPEGVKKVCAPVFVNRTAEPGIELFFTDALRQRLTHLGAHSETGCDARITGEIINIWGAQGVPVPERAIQGSYRVFGALRLRLLQGERLLTETEVQGFEDYSPGVEAEGDVLRIEGNRQAALRRLSETLVRDGYERLATAW